MPPYISSLFPTTNVLGKCMKSSLHHTLGVINAVTCCVEMRPVDLSTKSDSAIFKMTILENPQLINKWNLWKARNNK